MYQYLLFEFFNHIYLSLSSKKINRNYGSQPPRWPQCSLPPTPDHGWSVGPQDYSISDGMLLPVLGYERHCGFCFFGLLLSSFLNHYFGKKRATMKWPMWLTVPTKSHMSEHGSGSSSASHKTWNDCRL